MANVAEEIDPLPPGEQKLNIFWAPGVEAGPKHTISVTQTISSNGERLDLEADQSFYQAIHTMKPMTHSLQIG